MSTFLFLGELGESKQSILFPHRLENMRFRHTVISPSVRELQPRVAQRRQTQIGGQMQATRVVFCQLINLPLHWLQMPVEPKEVHGCGREQRQMVNLREWEQRSLNM